MTLEELKAKMELLWKQVSEAERTHRDLRFKALEFEDLIETMEKLERLKARLEKDLV